MANILEDDFCVGEWRVQPRLNRVEEQGHVVQIEPKMMQVLVYLAAHAGEVCTRQALLDAVWSDTVVGDEVLSRVISELRKIFGDDARAPTIIETIPRAGYRIIAAVSSCPGTAESPGIENHGVTPSRMEASDLSASTDSPSSPGPPRGATPDHRPLRRWIWNIALLLVGAGITGLILYLKTPPSAISILSTTPLTSLPGLELDPALSPDGNRVAFIWTGPENSHMDVFAKALGTEALLQLTTTPFYEYSPIWSPDGSHIAFARFSQGIFVMPALGGPERKVASLGPSSIPDLAWSPTGDVLVFTDRETPQTPYRLMRLNLDEGTVTPLTYPPATHFGDTDPAISPDGAWIAFARRSDRAAEVYVMSSKEGTPRRLTDDNADLAGLTWTADGTSIVFSSNRSGAYGLWQLPLAGGAPEWLPYGGTEVKEPAIQGDRLAFVQLLHEVNVWKQDLTDPNTLATPLLVSTREDGDPQFASDGRSLAFISSRSGHQEIWKSKADGTSAMQLTRLEGPHVSNPRWSPDGQRLVFDAHIHGQPDLFIVSAEGGRLQRLTRHDALDVVASWSRDGRWIYFSSNRSGAWEIWKLPVAGGTPVQVTNSGGFAAREGADGETLFFSHKGQGSLWMMPVAGGSPQRLVEDLAPGDWGNWDVTHDALYFVRYKDGIPVVMRYDLADQSTEQVGSLPNAPRRDRVSLSIAPDGKTLVFAQTDLVRFDLTVAKLATK